MNVTTVNTVLGPRWTMKGARKKFAELQGHSFIYTLKFRCCFTCARIMVGTPVLTITLGAVKEVASCAGICFACIEDIRLEVVMGVFTAAGRFLTLQISQQIKQRPLE